MPSYDCSSSVDADGDNGPAGLTTTTKKGTGSIIKRGDERFGGTEGGATLDNNPGAAAAVPTVQTNAEDRAQRNGDG